jgi:hypothetical protein
MVVADASHRFPGMSVQMFQFYAACRPTERSTALHTIPEPPPVDFSGIPHHRLYRTDKRREFLVSFLIEDDFGIAPSQRYARSTYPYM